LAVLLLGAGRVVLVERLIDEVWGVRPPRTARAALQGYVAQLRHALGEGADRVLVTEPGGYRLRVGAGELDLKRFDELVEQARTAAGGGDHGRARGLFGEALSLWRGPALADVALESSAGLEAARLEESRLVAVEERIESDLAVGRDAELVGELRELVAEYPLRERFHQQLMLALYRSGRQAEATEAYRDARDVLVAELGIEPGPGLRELEQAILAHDPGLRRSAEHTNRNGSVPVARPAVLASLTPLVGRARELAELDGLLARVDVRLVTVTGAGGIGKTRLALAALERAAERFADGAVVVLLAGVTDPELVVLEIARAVGVSEPGSEPVAERLSQFLAERELLLLLDNFEQLLDAAPLLVRLLTAARGLKLLVTSRALLHLSAEHVYMVPAMRLPDPAQLTDPDAVAESEAVALFVQRAGALHAGFALDERNVTDVAGVCARLEGIPLALELAAARTRLLTPRALVCHLDERLSLLTGGPRDAPIRQRTLRATLDWSYGLLDEPTQRLFARLSVFAGGFKLEAAQAVCADEGQELDLLEELGALVDHSLLEQRAGVAGEGRFAQLEIVREYARERLEQGGHADALRSRHAEYFEALAERGDAGVKGPDQASWFARLEIEHDNLRAALEWALAAQPPLALSIAGHLRQFWRYAGYLTEGQRWLERALAATPDEPSSSRASALRGLSVIHYDQGRHERAAALADEAVIAARALNDDRLLTHACNARAIVAAEMGELALARALYEEAATHARKAGDASAEMIELANLGCLAATEADYERAIALSEQALRYADQVGDRRQMSFISCNLAVCFIRTGRVQEALARLSDAARLSRASGDRFSPVVCVEIAAAAHTLTGQLERAAKLFACAESARTAMGRSLESPERELIEQALSTIIQQLDQPILANAWATGQTTGIDDALNDLLPAAGSDGKDKTTQPPIKKHDTRP
jgi:predicted ATPase/DNA-binding SARP family transcriptional activator